ncbi:hypothetical protein GCM10007036_22090 [Alsobacter metallidurans]|uniref:Uncharacterized protein n=1 Tax=Alsobacter metallidurans TaxID=340221 RepID=A0A917MI67_9HYPH|nr:hypothetical protein [Alsobacter metallidurans]GGH19299.1 hypothetical protein GCM10007036_22090 [Alsobacter metallidurans]
MLRRASHLCLALAAFGFQHCPPASAQGLGPVPGAIVLAQAKPGTAHDCTRLTEPLALRDCLDRAEDQRLQPTSEQPVAPGRIPDALLKAAGPESGRPSQAHREKTQDGAHAGARRDGVRVDQVKSPLRPLSEPP